MFLVAIISKWLHEGEQNAIGLYRRPWVAIMSCSAAVMLSLGLFFGPASARLVIVSVVVLLLGFGVLSWKRQAAILTPVAILFRPIFGKTQELSLTGVKRVSRIERPSGEGGWIEVCRLEFLVGGFFDIPGRYLGDLAGDLEHLIASPSRSRE
jgi:hypothetical protein